MIIQHELSYTSNKFRHRCSSLYHCLYHLSAMTRRLLLYSICFHMFLDKHRNLNMEFLLLNMNMPLSCNARLEETETKDISFSFFLNVSFLNFLNSCSVYRFN